MPAVGDSRQLCLGAATRRVAVCAEDGGERIAALQVNVVLREIVSPGEVVESVTISVDGNGILVAVNGR